MNKKVRVDKLQKLQARQVATTAAVQKLQKSIAVVKRKQDLQRKILVGSYYLEQAKNKSTTQELQKIMLSYLKKGSDKKLFEQTE